MRLLLVLSLSGTIFAQTKEPPPVTGMLNFIHAVSNLERSIAFYCDVFGFEKPNPPRPPNPSVPALIGVPGALLRVAVFRIPGASFGLEVTDFGGIERHPGQPRLTDPGAAYLTIRVRDINPVVAALKKAGAAVITRSGAPVNDTMFVRDPDGYPIEVKQVPPAADSPATGNILGAAMGVVVTEILGTFKFYREMFGFEMFGNMAVFGKSPAMLDLVGAPERAQYRHVTGIVPGNNSRIEFYDFKGIPLTPFRQRVPDPGTPAIAFRVTDLDSLLKRLKAAGVTVVSTDGEPTQFSRSRSSCSSSRNSNYLPTRWRTSLLFSWQMYSNNSEDGENGIRKLVVQGCVYALGSSIVTS